MQSRAHRCGSLTRLALLGGVMVGGLFAGDAPAAQRTVLMENFTATWCTHCPVVGRAIDDLMSAYPDTLVGIQYHVQDEYPLTFSDDRASFYGVFPLPDVWVDGLENKIGDFGSTDQANYDGFYAMYADRVNVPTPILLDLTVTPVNGQTYNVKADVELEAGSAPLRVDVYVIDCLFRYPDYADNRAHNMVRQGFMIGSLDLDPGQSATLNQEVTFDSTSWADQENIRIVGFVQEGADGGPAEVYQAALSAWPFGGADCPGDLNGDGAVNQQDLGILLAHYEIDDGGDVNGDGLTNQQDLGILLANYELPC